MGGIFSSTPAVYPKETSACGVPPKRLLAPARCSGAGHAISPALLHNRPSSSCVPKTWMVCCRLRVLQGEDTAPESCGRLFRRVLSRRKRLSSSGTHGGAHDSFLVQGGVVIDSRQWVVSGRLLLKSNLAVWGDG